MKVSSKPLPMHIQFTLDKTSIESVRTYFLLQSLIVMHPETDPQLHRLETLACANVAHLLGMQALINDPEKRTRMIRRCLETSRYPIEKQVYEDALYLLQSAN